MSSRENLVTAAHRQATRVTKRLGEEVRELRMAQGLSRRALVEGLPISQSKLARWESGHGPYPDLYEAAFVLRLLGQDLSVKLYPAGQALRDAAHSSLVGRFIQILPASVPRRLEAVIPGPGDPRAWDVLFRVGGVLVGVAAETRMRDFQALLRRERQKARDGGVDRLLLVLLNSHTNRRAVREAGESLRAALPLDGRTILPALRRGQDPGGNGVLFL
jgi:transcriptional regulator with XRE-family HTH domain